MKNTPKFYVCKHCGNIAEKLHDAGVPLVCCGEPMSDLVANTTEAAVEKHIPVFTQDKNCITVQVGSVLHPMLEEHYIGWVWLQTELGGLRACLAAGNEPKAVFALAEGDKAIAVYAWCNLHGLWKADF